MIPKQKNTLYTKAELESISCYCNCNCTAVIAPTLKRNETYCSINSLLFVLLPKSNAVRIQILNSTGSFLSNAVPSGSGATAFWTGILFWAVFQSLYVPMVYPVPKSHRESYLHQADERAAVRDASRALLPLFVFSCHALAAQQWMRDTTGWVHKRYKSYLPSLKQSTQSVHFTICISSLIVYKNVRFCKLFMSIR